MKERISPLKKYLMSEEEILWQGECFSPVFPDIIKLPVILWCIVSVVLLAAALFAVGITGLAVLPFPIVGILFYKNAFKEPKKFFCAVTDRRVMRLSEEGDFCAEDISSIDRCTVTPSMFLRDRASVGFLFHGKSSFDKIIFGINCVRLGDFYDLPKYGVKDSAEAIVTLVNMQIVNIQNQIVKDV